MRVILHQTGGYELSVDVVQNEDQHKLLNCILFYPDEPSILNICVHVNTARVSRADIYVVLYAVIQKIEGDDFNSLLKFCFGCG